MDSQPVNQPTGQPVSQPPVQPPVQPSIQPVNQPIAPPPVQPPVQPPAQPIAQQPATLPPVNQPEQEREISLAVKYIAGVVGVIVLALIGWYFYAIQNEPVATVPTVATSTGSAAETPLPALSGGNTTADITNDLNQIPDASAALDADAAASAQGVQSL